MVREVRDCYPIGGDDGLRRTCVEDRGPDRSDEENTSSGCPDSARAGRLEYGNGESAQMSPDQSVKSPLCGPRYQPLRAAKALNMSADVPTRSEGPGKDRCTDSSEGPPKDRCTEEMDLLGTTTKRGTP